MKPAIAILGAGPNGLALARLLTVKNINCRVFEREKSPDAVGQVVYGLITEISACSLVSRRVRIASIPVLPLPIINNIHTNSGQLALKECGLLDGFKSLARYDGQAFKVVDRNGDVTFDMPYDGQEARPEIDRKDLRHLLLDSIPPETIQWDARVEGVNRDADGSMALRFANGSAEKGFRLVVGADDEADTSWVTSATPQYSGLCYLQTTITTNNVIHSRVSEQVGTGSYMALLSGKQIVAQRQGNGSYNVYIGLRLAENWSKLETRTLLSPDFRRKLVETEFADWSPKVTDLIKYSDGPFYAWNLYAMPTESLSWESVPGIALTSDAAHVSTPFQGEGVNCAMFDSLQLAQEIAGFGLEHLNKAVRMYEEKMFPRAIDLISRSEENGKLLFAEDALQRFGEIVGDYTDSAAVE